MPVLPGEETIQNQALLPFLRLGHVGLEMVLLSMEHL